jgi:hypothetical protein
LYLASHWVTQSSSNIAETLRKDNPPSVGCVLSSLRNLYYHRYIQGRPASRAPLPGGYPWIFPLKIDICRYRVSANRAMNLAQSVAFRKDLHFFSLNSSDEKEVAMVVAKS